MMMGLNWSILISECRACAAVVFFSISPGVDAVADDRPHQGEVFDMFSAIESDGINMNCALHGRLSRQLQNSALASGAKGAKSGEKLER